MAQDDAPSGSTSVPAAPSPAPTSAPAPLDPVASTSSPASFGAASESAFYQNAQQSASSSIDAIRNSLHRFPTPALRIQRVNQLDAELLDRELSEMLLEPVKKALGTIKSTFPADLEPELMLFLKLVLFKYSIWDRGASYGSMLQNLKYRNEWAHRGGLQSTARDQPLTKLQLSLYPVLTILFPYLGTKFQARMTNMNYSEMPANDVRRRLWSLTDFAQRIWAAAVLTNFAVFLSNGKYRTVADRLLGMRLTYAQRTMNRNVSFEFLNRQLVWHAFTEFLLFLLPLVRPRRLFRKLMRLPTHPKLLSLIMFFLPRAISSRVGLVRDAQGKARFDRKAVALPGLSRRSSKRTDAEEGDDEKSSARGPYWSLPEECCAICFERMEKAAGVNVDPTRVGSGGLSMGIPSGDPLDPSRGILAPNRPQTPSSRQTPAASKGAGGSLGVSPDGLAYVDAIIHTPYRSVPCAHVYCYYCITSRLLAEDMEDELAEEGGWECLRCRARISGAERDEVPDVDEDDDSEESGDEDDGEEEDVLVE